MLLLLLPPLLRLVVVVEEDVAKAAVVVEEEDVGDVDEVDVHRYHKGKHFLLVVVSNSRLHRHHHRHP